MMTEFQQEECWSGLLKRLPADLDLEALAKATGALRRRRGVPSASALLRLALMRGPGGMSLRETASWAQLNNVATLTDPSLNDRLHQSEDFLKEILKHLLRSKESGPCGRWPGRVLRVADGTCLSQPGSVGVDWRVHAVYDLGSGGFSHLDVTDARGGEALDRGAATAGEIRLADRGYGQAKALRRFLSSTSPDGAQVDYVVRLRWSAMRLVSMEGQRFDLIDYLRRWPAERSVCDVRVGINDGSPHPPLMARLIIARKPPEAVEAERKRLRRLASRKQKELGERSLLAAQYMMLITSLPSGDYSAEDILAMYRLRWQIELAFKRLKSIVRIDRLACHTPKGARGWIYANLIFAMLIDDLTQDVLEFSP